MTHLRDRISQIIFDMGDGGASINCNKTADAILDEISLSKTEDQIKELESDKIKLTKNMRELVAANKK